MRQRPQPQPLLGGDGAAVAAANDRRLSQLLVGLLVLLAAAMAAPVVAGRWWALDDLGAFHLPLREFYSRCLRQGHDFDWMPSLFSGFFVSGEGQLGSRHPWHWLLYRGLPLRAAYSVELLTPYLAAAVGVRLWLGGQVATRAAAWYGAMAFACSSFMLLRLVHPNAVAIAAHVPWLLWAEHRLLAGSPRRAAVGYSLLVLLLTASQVLHGYPQYVWLSVLAEALMAVRWAFRNWSGAGLLVGLKLAGLLMAGAQLAPTWDAFESSSRSQADAAYLGDGSLHPLNLLQLTAPYSLRQRVVSVKGSAAGAHELSLYLGAAPLLLAVWGLGGGRHGRSLRVPAAALGLTGLALACGHYVGLIAITRGLPVVGSFRMPARHLLLFYLAASGLAANGFARLQQSGGLSGLPRLCGLLVASSVLAAAALWAIAPPAVQANWPLPLAGPALFASLGCLAVLPALARRPPLMLAALSLLTAVDLAGYGMSYAAWRATAGDLSELARVPPPPGPPEAKLLVERSTFDPSYRRRLGNALVLQGWRQADGYAGLEPRQRLWEQGVSLPALRAAGVGWVRRAALGPGLPESLGQLPGSEHWIRVPRPLPPFHLVVDAHRGELSEMPQIDPWETALVERALRLPPGPRGHIESRFAAPGRLEASVDLPAERLLVTTQRFDPGWRVESPSGAASLRVNGDFLGVLVPAGQHVVRLAFRPSSVTRGWQLAAVGAGLGLLMLFAAGAGGAGSPRPASCEPHEPTRVPADRPRPPSDGSTPDSTGPMSSTAEMA